jgi:hypothetical protein
VLTGLLMAATTAMISTITYGIGKMNGYDKWDRENESFQKGLNKNGI